MPQLSDPTTVVLIVADESAEPFRSCQAALRAKGLQVHVLPTVYAAMARLAQDDGARWALVDIRTLDKSESAFCLQAPRYFPGLEVVVADLPGADRITERSPGLLPMTVDHFIAEVTGQHHPQPRPFVEESVAFEAAIPVAKTTEASEMPDNGGPIRPAPAEKPKSESPHVSRPTPPASSPATKPTQDDRTAEPPATSLHEAVRMRMAGGDPRLVQRRRPPAPPPKVPEPKVEKPDLSDDELAALLDADLDNESTSERPRHGEGNCP